MKKTAILLFFICSTFLILAQTKENKAVAKLIHEMSKSAIRTKTPKIMDDYLAQNPLKTAEHYAYFYAKKALVLQKIHKNELRNRSIKSNEIENIKQEILGYYKKSIDTSSNHTLNHTLSRVRFLNTIGKKRTDDYKKDLNVLKAAGYKEDKLGIDFFVQYTRASSGYSEANNWIGGGISLKSLRPRYKLTYTNPKTGKNYIHRHNRAFAGNYFSIGYNYDWKNRSNDMNFSLIHLEAPLYLNLLKFGLIENAKFYKPVWYYRPEIGYGRGNVAIYYGHNFNLNKLNSYGANTHSLTIRFSQMMK